MEEFDSNEVRLQDTQHPAMYRAGCTLRSTFGSGDEMRNDLTALMLQLARVPGPTDDRGGTSGGKR